MIVIYFKESPYALKKYVCSLKDCYFFKITIFYNLFGVFFSIFSPSKFLNLILFNYYSNIYFLINQLKAPHFPQSTTLPYALCIVILQFFRSEKFVLSILFPLYLPLFFLFFTAEVNWKASLINSISLIPLTTASPLHPYDHCLSSFQQLLFLWRISQAAESYSTSSFFSSISSSMELPWWPTEKQEFDHIMRHHSLKGIMASYRPQESACALYTKLVCLGSCCLSHFIIIIPP